MICRAVGLLVLILGVLGLPLAQAADRTDIPLKNWGGFSVYRDSVYDDLERLVTAGFGGQILLSTKPLSRIEAARTVASAIEKIRSDNTGDTNMRRDLEPVLDRLIEEFRPELASLGVRLPGSSIPSPKYFSFLPVDRAQVGAGYSSRDLSLVNSQGFRLREGINGETTFETRAQIGDSLSFYLQPELFGNQEYSRARLATGYGKLTLHNVELVVGRESLWWGPALHGSLILSDNAPPMDQIRIASAEPFRLPWIGKWLGPTKLLFFLARLPAEYPENPTKLAGMRATIAPFPFLELGISRTMQFDENSPPRLQLKDYPYELLNPPAGDDPAHPEYRNNNVFAVDADLRLKDINQYHIPSRDLRLYGEFGWDDTCCDNNFFTANFVPLSSAESYLVGVQFLEVFGLESTDARFEFAKTSGLSFTHTQFTDGYAIHREVISHFIGTSGKDYYARVTNWLGPDVMVGMDLRSSVIGSTVKDFSGPKERRFGTGIDLSYRFLDKKTTLFSAYQFMNRQNRDFKSGDNGVDYLFRLELTRSFR